MAKPYEPFAKWIVTLGVASMQFPRRQSMAIALARKWRQCMDGWCRRIPLMNICVCVVCTCTCTYKRVYKHLYSRDTSMLHREQRISYALITSAAFAIIIEWAYHTHAPMPFALEYIYIYIYHIYYNSQQPLSELRLRPCICCELPSFSDLDVLIIILSGAVHTHNAHCTWAVASFSSCYCHHGIINVVVVVVLSRLPHPRSSSKWLGRINANIK